MADRQVGLRVVAGVEGRARRDERAAVGLCNPVSQAVIFDVAQVAVQFRHLIKTFRAMGRLGYFLLLQSSGSLLAEFLIGLGAVLDNFLLVLLNLWCQVARGQSPERRFL